MGMFDELRCEYPLPDVEDPGKLVFQTKSLDCLLDNYEIRADGSLWREHYDTEDQSNPNATGIDRLVGIMARVRKHWEREPYTGEIRFYNYTVDRALVFSACFVDGQLAELHQPGDE